MATFITCQCHCRVYRVSSSHNISCFSVSRICITIPVPVSHTPPVTPPPPTTGGVWTDSDVVTGCAASALSSGSAERRSQRRQETAAGVVRLAPVGRVCPPSVNGCVRGWGGVGWRVTVSSLDVWDLV